jgi:hypothetical protein
MQTAADSKSYVIERTEIPLIFQISGDRAPPLQPRAALPLAVAQGGVETLRRSDFCKGDLLSVVY